VVEPLWRNSGIMFQPSVCMLVSKRYMSDLFSRPYLALMLQCCVRLSVVICTECIVAKRCILEQKLLLTAKSYMRDRLVGLPKWMSWPLFGGLSRSCQPLRHIQRWISRKPLEIEARFQRTTNRKWHYGVSNGYVTDDVTWPRRCCEAIRSAILATASLLVYSSQPIQLCLICFNLSVRAI